MSPKTQAPPKFIMDDVKLLFNDLSNPETSVKFNPPERANRATIQGNVNPPPVTWTWADQAARLAQIVTQDDVSKYGIQTDKNVLFQLTNENPIVWQPVQIGTTATWTWTNVNARNAEKVTT